MSLTKLSLAGNNKIIHGQGVTSRLGSGKSLTFFTVYLTDLIDVQSVEENGGVLVRHHVADEPFTTRNPALQ
jgi:hypothetical protein